MKREYILTGAVITVLIVIAAALIFAIPHGHRHPVVYIVYGSEKGDLSYTDSAYRGLFAAGEAMQFDKQEFPSLDYDELSPLLNGSGPGRPDLVITVGYQYTRDTQRLAAGYPGIRFLAIDQAGNGSSNLKSFAITSYGESYLAGALAASVTKTGRVGIILGTQSELLEGFHQGYIEGARAVDPSVIIDSQYVRDNSIAGFSDPVRAGEIAGTMYGEGTDIIYTVAGFSGTGAIMEAKRRPGRYIIGVDSDQSDLGPKVVLASAVKRVDRVVYSGISEFLEGSFSGGSEVAGLREGVTGLVFNPRYASWNATIRAWEGKAKEAEARYNAADNYGR